MYLRVDQTCQPKSGQLEHLWKVSEEEMLSRTQPTTLLQFSWFFFQKYQGFRLNLSRKFPGLYGLRCCKAVMKTQLAVPGTGSPESESHEFQISSTISVHVKLFTEDVTRDGLVYVEWVSYASSWHLPCSLVHQYMLQTASPPSASIPMLAAAPSHHRAQETHPEWTYIPRFIDSNSIWSNWRKTLSGFVREHVIYDCFFASNQSQIYFPYVVRYSVM